MKKKVDNTVPASPAEHFLAGSNNPMGWKSSSSGGGGGGGGGVAGVATSHTDPISQRSKEKSSMHFFTSSSCCYFPTRDAALAGIRIPSSKL